MTDEDIDKIVAYFRAERERFLKNEASGKKPKKKSGRKKKSASEKIDPQLLLQIKDIQL